MAKQKSRQSKVSSGKMKAIHKAREEKRQAKFAAKRGTEKAYHYQSIEEATGAKKGSKEYNREKFARMEKAKSSRSEYAVWKSVNQKLDDKLAKEALAAAAANRKNKKAKTEKSA